MCSLNLEPEHLIQLRDGGFKVGLHGGSRTVETSAGIAIAEPCVDHRSADLLSRADHAQPTLHLIEVQRAGRR